MALLALLQVQMLLLGQALAPLPTRLIRSHPYLSCRCAVGTGIEGVRVYRTARLAPVVTAVLSAEMATPAQLYFMMLMPLGELTMLLCRDSVVGPRVPCAREGCPCFAYNNEPGAKCCFRCRRGVPCQGSVPVHTGWTTEIEYEGKRPTE